MRKNMPYMVLDITKKPGEPNAVKTGDMLLAENTKLREFAELVSHMNDDGYWNGSASICALVAKAKAALAEPVKNCEVGTAEEQYSRMFRECYEWMCMDCKQNKDLRKCALSWAQKPYVEKEGGNDGNK